MPILPARGLFRIILVALLISMILILVILVLLNYPMLRTTENLNIFLTIALVAFAFVEVLSTLSKANIERKRKRTVDLRNELEKFFGPVHSVLNNIVYEEIKTGILTQRQRMLLDETFSKEPIVLTAQEEWRLRIRNLDISSPIPMRFIEHFNNEYEKDKGKNAIEKRFSHIHSMLKDVPQKVEEVGILSLDEKTFVDKRFSNYPYMPSQELYDYWKEEIRPLKITVNALEHALMLLENPRPDVINSKQNKPGLYLVPKAFVTKFLEEYDKKVNEYHKP